MNNWIKISDQLPEQLNQVLIYSERGIEFAYLLKNLDVFMINHTIRSDKNFVKITHWMPLPNPPQEKTYEDLFLEQVMQEHNQAQSDALIRGANAFPYKSDPKVTGALLAMGLVVESPAVASDVHLCQVHDDANSRHAEPSLAHDANAQCHSDP